MIVKPSQRNQMGPSQTNQSGLSQENEGITWETLSFKMKLIEETTNLQVQFQLEQLKLLKCLKDEKVKRAVKEQELTAQLQDEKIYHKFYQEKLEELQNQFREEVTKHQGEISKLNDEIARMSKERNEYEDKVIELSEERIESSQKRFDDADAVFTRHASMKYTQTISKLESDLFNAQTTIFTLEKEEMIRSIEYARISQEKNFLLKSKNQTQSIYNMEIQQLKESLANYEEKANQIDVISKEKSKLQAECDEWKRNYNLANGRFNQFIISLKKLNVEMPKQQTNFEEDFKKSIQCYIKTNLKYQSLIQNLNKSFLGLKDNSDQNFITIVNKILNSRQILKKANAELTTQLASADSALKTLKTQISQLAKYWEKELAKEKQKSLPNQKISMLKGVKSVASNAYESAKGIFKTSPEVPPDIMTLYNVIALVSNERNSIKLQHEQLILLNSQMEDNIESLKDTIKLREFEIGQLKTQIAKLKAQLVKKIKDFQTYAFQTQLVINQSEKNLADTSLKLRNCQTKLYETKQILKSTKLTLVQTEDSLKDTKKSLIEEENKLIDVSKKLTQKQKDYQKLLMQKENLNKFFLKEKASKESLEAEIANLNEDIRRYKQEILGQKQDLKQASAKIQQMSENINSKISLLEKSNAEVNKTKSSLTLKTKEVQTALSNLEITQGKLDDTKKQLEQAKRCNISAINVVNKVTSCIFGQLEDINEENMMKKFDKIANEVESAVTAIKYFQNSAIMTGSHVENISFLIKGVEDVLHKRVNRTRLLYKYDPINKENFHQYFDGIFSILLVVKLKNGTVIGGYTYYPFIKGREDKEDSPGIGFIFSLSLREIFPLKKQVKASVNSYEDHAIYFGNAQIRMNTNEDKLFSNFGILSSTFDCKKRTYQNFLNSSEREVDIQTYEIYEMKTY